MAQIQLKGFLVYQTADYWPEERRWGWLAYDPREYKDTERVVVREEAITVEVPDGFDPRSAKLAAKQKELEQVRAEMGARVTQIMREIQQLQAIEMSEVQS
ncbi:hypothetical protein GCM10028796_17520 [Ramlibacter monticola]|uniref:Uncharacterized protein n=1 Tax=Ramlibacter monticola TaxID=1926872 RepID=A0A936YZ49_9BURK|nr:hypothetical protein [Ramlibacter monticola]MBL0390577.1 hypothetical protein [Ramlibacter monticola]